MEDKLAGLPVEGYRPQSHDSVEQVNQNKALEEKVLRRIEAIMEIDDVDKRWLAIGRTHIEEGFMAINRAIFKPGRVTLRGD